MDTAGLVLGFIAVIGGISVALFAIWSTGRQQARKRELEHLERMRALELGRTFPQDEPVLSSPKVGPIIAIVVPSVAFISAGSATQGAGYEETIWIATAMVGTAAVICGTALVATSRKKDNTQVEKPYLAEDAQYDVVGTRG